MEQLDELNLSFNSIPYINEDVFWDLPNLTTLRLWVTKIEKLPEKIFSNLRKLSFLELSNNKLTHLPRDLFANNLELSTVLFTENDLKIIDVDFRKLTKINYIGFSRAGCITESFYGVNQTLQDLIDHDCTGV